VAQNGKLWFATDLLATNSLPGLTNSPPNLMASSVVPTSEHNGRVALVSTQAWVRRFSGETSYPDYGRRLALDDGGNLYIAGESLGTDLKYALVILKYGADGTSLWTNHWHGPVGSDAFARFLAVDATGNIYLSGDFETASEGGVVMIKYAANGSPLWTNSITSGGPEGLGLDKAGNLYVLVSPSGSSVSQFITLKYDPTGHPVWTNVYKATPTGADYPVALALDDAGNVFVSGSSDGPGTGLNYATIKYAPDGTGLWTNRYVDTAYGQIVEAMTLDRDGNVIVTGDAMRYVSHLYATVKYASNGTPLWTNLMEGPVYQGGAVPRVNTDLAGNVFILSGSPGANSNDADFTLVKLTKDGVPLWTSRFFETNTGNPAPEATATDSAGNFYLTGSWNSGGTNDDYVIVKWAADGTALWTNRYDGPANSDDWVQDLAVDPAGHVYVTGASKGVGTDFDFGTVKFADFVSYTPPPGFVGSDSFTFTLTDSLGRSATGVANVAVVPTWLQFDTSSSTFGLAVDGFHFHVVGAASSAPVVVYSSLDLVNWQPILTNAPVSGAASFTDPGATNYHLRFYRAAQQQ